MRLMKRERDEGHATKHIREVDYRALPELHYDDAWFGEGFTDGEGDTRDAIGYGRNSYGWESVDKHMRRCRPSHLFLRCGKDDII